MGSIITPHCEMNLAVTGGKYLLESVETRLNINTVL
jgi:hypothetical protein